MNKRLAVLLAVIAGVVVLVVWPKKKLTPEDEIRKLVAECVQAAEDKKPGEIIEKIDESFRGPQNARKDEIKGLLVMQILRDKETVAVFNPTLDVKMLSETEGEIHGKFIFGRTKAENAEALRADQVVTVYEIDATVSKASGAWLFTKAAYRRGY